MKTKILIGTTTIIHLMHIPCKMVYEWIEDEEMRDGGRWSRKEIIHKPFNKGILISASDIERDWDITDEGEMEDTFQNKDGYDFNDSLEKAKEVQKYDN